MLLNRRSMLWSLSGACAAPALCGCAQNPATGRRSFTGLYSLQDDVKMGKQAHDDIVKEFGGAYDSPKLTRYIEKLGQRLAEQAHYQELPYRFTLLNSPIVNAMALPGGGIYLTRGLLALASNEAELVSVIGHELGHVNARHTAERLSQGMVAQIGILAVGILGGQAVQQYGELLNYGAAAYLNSYSRDQELEADKLGITYMGRAGYDAEAAVSFLATLAEHSRLQARTLGRPESSVDAFDIMATHPQGPERVKRATDALFTVGGGGRLLNRDPYLDAIDGMLFGSDPKEGVITGSRFAHPDLRIAFEAARGTSLFNAPTQVVGQDDAGGAVVFDMAPLEGSTPAKHISGTWARGVRAESVTAKSGARGAGAWTSTQGKAVYLLAFEAPGGRAARFACIAGERGRAQVEQARDAIVSSYQVLSESEAKAIRPLILHVETGITEADIPKLAASLPYGGLAEDWFRLLNDREDGAALGRTTRVKVVKPV